MHRIENQYIEFVLDVSRDPQPVQIAEQRHAVRIRRYHPRKIFENSDAKSCILVTLAVKFLAFGNYGQEVGGPIHCWPPNLKVGGTSLPRSLRLLRLRLQPSCNRIKPKHGLGPCTPSSEETDPAYSTSPTACMGLIHFIYFVCL